MENKINNSNVWIKKMKTIENLNLLITNLLYVVGEALLKMMHHTEYWLVGPLEDWAFDQYGTVDSKSLLKDVVRIWISCY
jgi:hypothetical protein